jgi:hypothetical protein
MKGYVLVRWALIDTNQALTTAELNDFVSDIVYTLHGDRADAWERAAGVRSGINKGRRRQGQLFHRYWSYAPEETQRDLIAAVRWLGGQCEDVFEDFVS